jgi:hypothetical protein
MTTVLLVEYPPAVREVLRARLSLDPNDSSLDRS